MCKVGSIRHSVDRAGPRDQRQPMMLFVVREKREHFIFELNLSLKRGLVPLEHARQLVRL